MERSNRRMSPRRHFRWTVGMMLVLMSVAIVLACRSCGSGEIVATEDQIETNMDALHATPPPEPLNLTAQEGTANVIPSEDVILLAKIMQEEDGYEWPDWAIMAIGEVVLNRVSSVEFPDTIEAVLTQENPEQYAPVHFSRWANFEPEERYVELAKRLLGGERVLNNPQIIYQALFEQGSGTVLSYHDVYLGSTTYFCLTDSPDLYV